MKKMQIKTLARHMATVGKTACATGTTHWSRCDGERPGGASKSRLLSAPATRRKQKHELRKIYAAHVHCGAVHDSRAVGAAWVPGVRRRGGKRWRIRMMEPHSATEKDEVLPAATTWVQRVGAVLGQTTPESTRLCGSETGPQGHKHRLGTR